MKKPLNVTFDTNIFDEYGFDLGAGSMLSLLISYVQNRDIKLYLSNVVVGEMRGHCTEYAENIIKRIEAVKSEILNESKGCEDNNKRRYHRVSRNFLGAVVQPNLLQLSDKKTAAKKAEEYLDSFILASKAIELKSDQAGISIDEIIDDYFQHRFPFENSEKKKSEFPDAVIAAQLKCAFSATEPVYFITKDGGLKNALKEISYVIVLPSLEE